MQATPPAPTRLDVAPSRLRALLRGEPWKISVFSFLVALVLLIVVMPLTLDSPHGVWIESVLITLVLLTAVPAVGGGRRTFVASFALVAPAVLGKWISSLRPDLVPESVVLAAAIVFSGFINVLLVRFILMAPRVDFQVLCAGIATYLMLALFWAFVYMLVSQLVPNAFAFSVGPERPLVRFEALYFSFITLNTVGYGDIVPATGVTRMLAMLEATVGTLYMAVMVARLVSLYALPESPEDLSSKENPP